MSVTYRAKQSRVYRGKGKGTRYPVGEGNLKHHRSHRHCRPPVVPVHRLFGPFRGKFSAVDARTQGTCRPFGYGVFKTDMVRPFSRYRRDHTTVVFTEYCRICCDRESLRTLGSINHTDKYVPAESEIIQWLREGILYI